ncbi:MAG: acyl-CoA thioesterase [Flavobacteriaceae bacterium]|jgi:acyl-CoA hydrolase|nr:acyl-CoA thioesterase [Flavobacteriaceae bacterium]
MTATTSKAPRESQTVMTTIVLASETNAHNNMFGGDLLALMDRACAIAAMRHSQFEVVTVSVSHVSFDQPIPLGTTIEVVAKVSKSFGSSMEVFADVWIDDISTHKKTKSNQGVYIFVAVNDNMKPVKVPELVPETEEEKERFMGAQQRRELSLIMSGKLNPKEAIELKKLFLD